MKNIFFLLTFVCIFSFNSIGQKDEYLQAYAQVWGFLKYHHPFPSSVDWDERLLNDYSSIDSEMSQNEFQKLIDRLFEDCKEPTDKRKKATKEIEYMPYVFDWLVDNKYVQNHYEQIELLRSLPADFKNSYVQLSSVGAVFVESEKTYIDAPFTSAYCYLALARYWNIVNYFFPYRAMIEEDWNSVFLTMLPDFENANTYSDYYRAILKLRAFVKDGHAFVKLKDEVRTTFSLVNSFAPFHSMDLEDGTFISLPVSTPDFTSPLKRGDKIISLNGVSTEEQWHKAKKMTNHSNDYTARRSDYFFKQFDSDSVEIVVLREEGELVFTVPTITSNDFVVFWEEYKKSKPEITSKPYELKMDSLSGKRFLYVDMGEFKKKDMTKQVKKIIHSQDYIVLDVRNYPSYIYPEWTQQLLKGKRHFALSGAMSTHYPGSISWVPTQKVGGNKEFKGTVIILVDRQTQSHAEYTVMALQQHPRAITVGGQTAGADGNVFKIPMPYGVDATLTGIAIVYPDGTETQQIGIKRDIEVIQDSSYLNDPKNDKIMNVAIGVIRR